LTVPAAHLHLAYGLAIRSFLPLPELVPGGSGADVVVREGRVEAGSLAPLAAGRSFAVEGDSIRYAIDGAGRFLVRGGEEIVVEPAPGVEAAALRLILLGPVLALLLRQRGLLVLHASAVALAGRAVAFLGASGRGKSTTAGALLSRGHRLVADDVTAVLLDGDTPRALPGFPQLKLWPEAAESLEGALGPTRRLAAHLEKHASRVAAFDAAPLPLERLYVLADGESHSIEPLSPQEAFLELVRHSYGARLLPALGAPRHLLQCGRLLGRTAARRLAVERSLERLSALAQAIEADLLPAAGASGVRAAPPRGFEGAGRACARSR
jgi:hypothetical protein